MNRRSPLIGMVAVILLVGTQAWAQDARAGGESAEWWKAQRDVVDVLMEERADFADLLARVRAKPRSAQEAMFRLNVLMRGGMNEEARETLSQLRELSPDLSNHQIGGIYYAACDEFSSWDLAQAVVEVFASNISQLALENRLLKHFEEAGWSVEKVDRWLADMPTGIENFWVKERLRFNVVRGRGDWLVRELVDRVKGNPQDIAGAIALLDGLIYARHTGEEKWDLSWMAETTKPTRATEAESIALRLKTLGQLAAAITFYSQAIETPLTDEEVHDRGMMCQVMVSPGTLRATFAAHARDGMAECLLTLGRNDEAQKWMVEADDIRQKHKLGRNAFFAGRVQAGSGQRTVEERIEEQEKKSEDDPEYWRERARYFRGRGEPALEEEALVKGLALTTPQPRPARPGKGYADSRSSLLRDYARFLARVDRTGEAVALLRKEIAKAPAGSASAEAAARLLAFDFQKHISVDDESLWNWLANRPRWEHVEERLLWRMLERARRDDLDKHFSRAEELTTGKHPSRAQTLGWIMNRMGFPKRSIPLLQRAVQEGLDENSREGAAFALFESYLDTHDWRRAEAIFPNAAKRLTPREVSDWYARIAVAAAKAGANAEAMRIWRAVAKVNPAEMRALDDLVKAGLRDELAAFYREMRKSMPSSEIPARALEVIHAR